MPLIQNRNYAGQKLLIGSEIVGLDADGIGMINSQEMADAVIQSIAGFESVGPKPFAEELEPVKEAEPVADVSIEDQIAASLAEDGLVLEGPSKTPRTAKLRTAKKA